MGGRNSKEWISLTWLQMKLYRSYRNPWIPYIPPNHGSILITATENNRSELLSIHLNKSFVDL